MILKVVHDDFDYKIKIEDFDLDNISILKEIDIENCTCYDFDDIIKIADFDLDNILINEKLYKKFCTEV